MSKVVEFVRIKGRVVYASREVDGQTELLYRVLDNPDVGQRWRCLDGEEAPRRRRSAIHFLPRRWSPEQLGDRHAPSHNELIALAQAVDRRKTESWCRTKVRVAD